MTSNFGLEQACNFSIIIAHKNIPVLLQRCLDSLPPRADTQILVVDDNSSPDVVDFSRFPGSDRADVEVLFNKQCRGTGHARNLALRLARGKWVTMLDADDMFSEAYGSVLDEVADRPEDLVFFCYRTVMSDDITRPGHRMDYLNRFTRAWLDGDRSETNLRFRHSPASAKFIRRSLIEQYGLKMDEVIWSNDIFFSSCAGCHARSIGVIDADMYIVTTRSDSLTTSLYMKKGEFVVRALEMLKAERYVARHAGVRHVRKEDKKDMLLRVWKNKGKRWFALTCVRQAVHPRLCALMLGFACTVLYERITKTLR